MKKPFLLELFHKYQFYLTIFFTFSHVSCSLILSPVSCILSNSQHVYYVQIFLNWQQLFFVPVFDAAAMLISAVKWLNCTHISNLKWNKMHIYSAQRSLQITERKVQQLQAQHAPLNTYYFTLQITHKFHKVVSHCMKCTCANWWQCSQLSIPDMFP